MFYAIIGKPIKHSRSPLMQNTALRAIGLPHEYRSVEIDPEHLQREVLKLVADGCAGFNVTIPHKQAVLPLLHSIDGEAKTIGAVNTVIVKNGSLHGYNTDVDGLRASLHTHKERILGTHALLLGAGGAAQTAVYSLVNDFHVAHLTIAARNPEQARKLGDSVAERAAISVCSFDEAELRAAVEQSRLIVNSTPLGMHPNVDTSPLPAAVKFHQGQIVFDLIYTPLQTTLLRRASSYGAAAINGLEMLIQQGARAFELFTGKQMPVDVIREVLLESLSKK